MKDFKYVNTTLGAALFALGLWCFAQAGEYVPLIEMEGQIGAQVFPQLFAGVLMFLSALMALLDVKKFTKATLVSFEGIGIVALISLLCFLFWYLIPLVGFLAVACGFVCLTTVLATRRIRPADLLILVAVTGTIYFVFANLLRIPLPRGFFV
jgi:hypothetical protein